MQENPNMSISPIMAAFLVNYLNVVKPTRTLEFGTGAGAATGVLARFSKQVITLDHDLGWSKHAQQKLQKQGVHNVAFFVGYNINLPFGDFDFVFVDGPPGGEARKNVVIRYWKYIKPGATIIMDDAHRKEEVVALQTWSRMYKAKYEIIHKDRGIGILIKPAVK